MYSAEKPKTKYLKDYSAPRFLIPKIDLNIELYEEHAIVHSHLSIVRNGAHAEPLILDGEGLTLLSISLNGEKVEHIQNEDSLMIQKTPDAFDLYIATKIYPRKNLELKGLYQSNEIFCTQCEAEGFRNITYFIDRPDVLSTYTVRIEADHKKYPVLLSNGNLIEAKALENNRHEAIWNDPFPKPCYLFALVAGDLDCHSDSFKTMSGRHVDLHIYAERGQASKCVYAMDCLKRSMKWDEETYGCEYDLSIFNIVAVSDFNMGAMENKSLNIFNSKYILVDPATATDDDYKGVEIVVSHEYFHNWTGNRITCRDWFQLSLKEGLTVYRDHCFTADMNSQGVERIQQVKTLRQAQFPEDAGPMSHPIRPDHYIQIDNFYTPTVYEKGSEVIRMMNTILGPEKYRMGTDLYFRRHDGQAVTCDDFVSAMQDASGINLDHFRKWYSQSGTPEVTVTESYDPSAKTYQLHLRQYTKPSQTQPQKEPLTLPMSFALLDKKGKEMSLSGQPSVYLFETEQTQLKFENISEKPKASLFRGFSAPIKLRFDQSLEDVAFLAAHDQDDFNRWENGQRLMTHVMMDSMKEPLSPLLAETIESILTDAKIDPAMKKELLSLPSETVLGLDQQPIRVDENHEARQALRRSIAHHFYDTFMEIYQSLNRNLDQLEGAHRNRRALKNMCLSFMAMTEKSEAIDLCVKQVRTHPLMTDIIGGLAPIADVSNTALRDEIFDEFYTKWQSNALVVNKWFSLQALSNRSDAFVTVKKLTEHPGFDAKNPNKVYALLLTFAANNHAHFHHVSGEGYNFVADQIIAINQFNPHPAVRLVSPLIRWRQYDEVRSAHMCSALERILTSQNLSKELYEIVSKSLDRDVA